MDSHKVCKLMKNILKTQLDKGTTCAQRAWETNGKNSVRVGNKSVNLKQPWNKNGWKISLINFTFCSEFYLYLNELLKPGWREKLAFPTRRNDLICELHSKFWTLMHRFGQCINPSTRARHFSCPMYREKKKLSQLLYCDEIEKLIWGFLWSQTCLWVWCSPSS